MFLKDCIKDIISEFVKRHFLIELVSLSPLNLSFLQFNCLFLHSITLNKMHMSILTSIMVARLLLVAFFCIEMVTKYPM